ncbi:uncharacterized protein LOC134219416 [Armigeres subalbatus]|uniref:uncharacterized protein LOC134219416 n=1 Tax=Armigeres subalbatus TaxID=124917 RepID=UPI002ED1C18F
MSLKFSLPIAQKFTNNSLMHVNTRLLEEIGIVEKGPQVLILSVAAELKEAQGGAHSIAPDPSTSQSGPSHRALVPSSESVTLRQNLERDAICRGILYKKIDAGIIPNHKELLSMVRTLYNGMASKLLNENIYPSTEENKNLVKKIIETFPLLAATKLIDNSPDYSYFFWKNAGKGPNHEHSGLIHTHMRNRAKKLKPEEKKYIHKKKGEKICNVSDEIMELAGECSQKDGTAANFNVIIKYMEQTHSLYLMMIQNKKGFQLILQTFPHFKSFYGVMIQKTYERITPNYDRDCMLARVFARGLMFDQDMFVGVQDDNLRGCLRVMVMLTRRGVKHQNKNIDNSLNIEHQLASDLIRFVPETESSIGEQLARYVAYYHEQHAPVAPHIICKGTEYFLFIAGELIECGESSVQALDVFFKCFIVFDIPVPSPLQKLHDLVEISCYKVRKHSTRQSVNRLCGMLLESCKAEEA